MSSSRSSFASGTIFGIVLGVLLGHFGIWRNTADRPGAVPDGFPVQEASLPGMSFDLGKKSENLPYFPEGELQPVTDYPEPEFHAPAPEKHSPLANAIAMETVEVQTVQATKEPAVVNIQTPAEEPQPLDIEGAAPIETHATNNDVALRKIIEEELTHIPGPQRDVWFESLKDMHVDDAQGVIRMWKLIGGPIPGLGEDSLIQPPLSTQLPVTPTPVENAIKGENSNSEAIKAAIAIVQRNLLMESTLGYMRIVPKFQEEVVNGIPVITGITEEIDFTTGKQLQTDRLLDIMIQGPGFFEVQDEDGNNFLTRRGRFSLNAKNQLTIVDSDTEYVLQPPVEIPEGSHFIKFETNGQLSYKDEAGKEYETGERIQTVRILNSEKLSYYKNALFQYGGIRIKYVPGTFGSGPVYQGLLEISNVNIANEQQHLEWFKKLLKQ